MYTRSVVLYVLIAIGLSGAAVVQSQSRNPRLVGGTPAATDQFPYQASLRYVTYHICTGAIISENWVLTIGQCVDGLTEQYYSIGVGSNDIQNGGVFYDVEQIVMHPGYNGGTLENDIALLETTAPIMFSASVTTISIGTGVIGAGIMARASSWGTLGLNQPDVAYLLYLDLVTLNSFDCRSRLPAFYSARVDDDILCAYSNEIGRGMCYGDYGSPLVANGELIGLNSWCVPYAVGRPDAFTRLSAFIPWIEEMMA